MRGHIGELIQSNVPSNITIKKQIFRNEFQTIAQFNNFLNRNLVNGSVVEQLKSYQSSKWQTKTFQALFVACWLHHPVEKGTYMINLSHIGPGPQKAIANACQENLKSRVSSHLSGSGYSASEGWNFLMGYNELLIQIENTNGVPHLMLKTEGHTTDIAQLPSHMLSWANKLQTGKGKVANASLQQYAKDNDLIESRAAENYSKGYEKILKALELNGKMVTARELIFTLFSTLNATINGKIQDIGFFEKTGNRQLGEYLMSFVDWGSDPNHYYYQNIGYGTGNNTIRREVKISSKELNALKEMAETLIRDGNQILPRVYREIRVTPASIDESLSNFRKYARVPVVVNPSQATAKVDMAVATPLEAASSPKRLGRSRAPQASDAAKSTKTKGRSPAPQAFATIF